MKLLSVWILTALILVFGSTTGHTQNRDVFSKGTSHKTTQWQSNSGADSTSGFAKVTYGSFDGDWRGSIFTAQADDIIVVAYKARVDEGRIRIQLMREDGDASFTAETLDDNPIDGQVRIPVENPGRYAVTITSDSRDGRFEIAWRIVR